MLNLTIVDCDEVINATIEDGVKGGKGLSAYQVAVQEGFVGTVDEWLESLVGPPVPVAQELGDDPDLAVSQKLLTDAVDDMLQANSDAVSAATEQASAASQSASSARASESSASDHSAAAQQHAAAAEQSASQASESEGRAAQSALSAGTDAQSAQAAAQDAHGLLDHVVEQLADKVDKADIAQATGTATDKVMSQKAVTELIGDVEAVLIAINGEPAP